MIPILTFYQEIRAIFGQKYSEEAVLKQIKTHPFYNDTIDASEFIDKLKNINDEDIRSFVNEIPLEWLNQLDIKQTVLETQKLISDRLIENKSKAEHLNDKLEKLRVMTIEREEERKLRTLNNKNAFMQKFGENK